MEHFNFISFHLGSDEMDYLNFGHPFDLQCQYHLLENFEKNKESKKHIGAKEMQFFDDKRTHARTHIHMTKCEEKSDSRSKVTMKTDTILFGFCV